MLTCARPARGRSRPSARTPGKPPPRSRTTAAISRATSTVAAREVDVERDQRPPRADEDAARRRVEPRRPEVGRELARVDPPLQLLGAAAAEERRPAAGADVGVEEDGQSELLADAPRELSAAARARAACPRAGSARSGRRRRRRSAGARRRAAQVDPLPRARDAREERVDELVARSPTSVNTERLWSASAWTSSSSRLPSAGPIASTTPIAAFGEVRHRLERAARPYSRTP